MAMKMSSIQQLCRSLRAPATAQRFRDAGVGLLFILFNEMLVVPMQIALDVHGINLPASILVMLLLALLMIIASSIRPSVAQFYDKQLRGPTDWLGRHMSLGFVPFLIMLNRDHITNGADVPKIAGAFVLTASMSYVFSIFFTIASYKLEHRLRGGLRKKPAPDDLERHTPTPLVSWPAPTPERHSKRFSQLSQFKTASITSIEALTQTTATSPAVAFLVRTAPTWICLLLLILMGLPAYLATGSATAFDAVVFTLFWVVSVQLARWCRASYTLLRHPHLRSVVVVLANPLLVAGALGSAYLWLRTAYTGLGIGAVVSAFRRHGSLAESVRGLLSSPAEPTPGSKTALLAAHLGAGDLASLVLDAGIASLGLKMFEHRRELWASFGAVFGACAAAAALNVFVNPLVAARAFHLAPADAAAFAARSATIALGVPAAQNLGASPTLMSALAIFNGILFQMAADAAFRWLRVDDRRGVVVSAGGGGAQRRPPLQRRTTTSSTQPPRRPRLQSRTSSGLFLLGSSSVTAVAEYGEARGGGGNGATAKDDSRVVAAGVTAGINAAAMGTAHLIERDSRATAYSALAMTVFGAVTVALSALPGAAGAIAALTSASSSA
ncbi:hypothetical protein F4780DRAFT_784565 [Xylariomycetidae sp. FL0641]|nr:hypothetical protein F4780DRAFT_784565 [Xylariomycetidae sp. FL0641]